MFTLLTFLSCFLLTLPTHNVIVQAGEVPGHLTFANMFVDPTYLVGLRGQFNKSTLPAQATILSWADELAAQGPWSVTDKTFTPTGASNKDYVSFAPYWWPDCSEVGNKTELTQEEVWKQCPYVPRDGQFNPDYLTSAVNNSGAINALSDTILYNAFAFLITNDEKYENTVAEFIRVFFLDEEKGMNPNLNYAQMLRGPDGQKGNHVGILDLRSISKILSGVLTLRQTNSTAWTKEIDDSFRAWSKEYIAWLTTAKIAIEERESLNNHGSYYFNQLASFQILVDDFDGAKETLEDYFNGIYQGQIDGDGEQPFEAERTLPYHYRSYNALAACINARLAQYVSLPDPWTRTTKSGGTLEKAFNYIISNSTPPPSDEDPSPLDLFPAMSMFASANAFGDPGDQYRAYLEKRWDEGWGVASGKSDFGYGWMPWVFWEVGLVDPRSETMVGSVGQPSVTWGTDGPSNTENASEADGSDNGNGGVALITSALTVTLVAISLLMVGMGDFY